MMGLKMLLLLGSLLAVLEVRLVASSHHGRSMPGSPSNVSRTDPGLLLAVLSAAGFYNRQSNDAFLFKPSAIDRAQRQLVKGLKYIVDLEISRTVCRKRDDNHDNLSNCDLQPEGRLHQTFQCHTEVWVVPWQGQTTTLKLNCKTNLHHLRL
ncbi:cystatin-F-like [Sebastes fasciatus]|uniref:cystatin-F-like n=1 Tax=Sebastes fasciatus TaxID=394691 RepID=UPI003D9EBC4E